jgi:hypothetical protein
LTGREKIEAAFSSEGASEFAVVIPYEGIYIRDRWDELTGLPWWRVYDPDIDRELEWRSGVIGKLGLDWFALPVGASREEKKNLRIEERADGAYLVNQADGSEQRLQPPVTGGWNPTGEVESHRPGEPARTRDEIDRVLPPFEPRALSRMQWHGADNITTAMLTKHGEALTPIWHVSSPLWSCYGLWGFEEMMTMVAEQPDLVRYACERYLAHAVDGARVGAALGAEIIWIEECLTDQISPDAFAALNVPFVARLVDEIRAVGLKSVYYYCGDPAGKWDHILSAGADALALEEGKKGFEIDIREAAEFVRGRCVLLGNVDAIAVLENGTDEELRAEVERQAAAGRANGSRFIMSVGSPVTPGTPAARVRLFADLAHGAGG